MMRAVHGFEVVAFGIAKLVKFSLCFYFVPHLLNHFFGRNAGLDSAVNHVFDFNRSEIFSICSTMNFSLYELHPVIFRHGS